MATEMSKDSLGAGRIRPDDSSRHLRLLLCLIALSLVLYQAWVGRNVLDPDGVSYLDVGDAYFRGEWDAVRNAYWSPLYSWIVGGVLAISRTSPAWELTVVHLVNIGIFFFVLACFRFLWRTVSEGQRADGDHGWQPMVIAWTIAIWSSIRLIGVDVVTPDLCLAGFVYLAAGLAYRAGRGDSNWRTAVALGIVLGIGYLAKAPLFVLSGVFIATCTVQAGIRSKQFRAATGQAALAFLFFAICAGPFVLFLSQTKDRLTFGDSGRLNYAWYVNGTTYRHWQGGPEANGQPAHPTRKVLDNPPIYEYGTPVRGTYPVWNSPDYWYDGVHPYFDWKQQVARLQTSVKVFAYHFCDPRIHRLWTTKRLSYIVSPVLIVGWILLALQRSQWPHLARNLAGHIALLLCSLAALGMYALVYFEPRHVAPFVAVIFVSLFSSLRTDLSNRQLLSLVAVIALVSCVATLVVDIPRLAQRTQMPGWLIAEQLEQAGLQEGDRIATLDYGNLHSGWARLARVQIVAELYEDENRRGESSYWSEDAARQEQVHAAFMRAGARAVVGLKPSGPLSISGWQTVGETGLCVYFLR